MRKNSFKIVRLLALSLFVVLGIGLLTGGLTIGGILAFLSGGGTATMAMAAGAGYAQEGDTVVTNTDSTTSYSTKDFLDNDISTEITKLLPSAFPLDTILRKTGKIVPIKSWETEWYSVDVRGVQDSVKGNISAQTGATTWTSHDINVNNIHIWSVDDNIKVSSVTSTGAAGTVTGIGGDLVLHVVGKTASTSTLSVIALNAHTGNGTTASYNCPALADRVLLTRIGNSKAETDAQTSPYATFPAKSSNYCQIHMAQVEESVFMQLHKRDGNIRWDLMDYQMQSLYDLRRSMENTSLFGVKYRVYDPVGTEWKYFSGGIYNAAKANGKSLTYAYDISDDAHTIDNDKFLLWAKTIFTGNSGSDTRFLFAGSDLMQFLGSVGTIQKQLDAKSTEIVYGIKFNKIETPFGNLLIKKHETFNDNYMAKNGLVLDMNHVEKHVFKPMETRELDFIRTGQKNANAYVVDETFCLALRYPDTHAVITCTVSA